MVAAAHRRMRARWYDEPNATLASDAGRSYHTGGVTGPSRSPAAAVWSQ